MSSITLWGAVYDTDHVDLPKTGGGTVRFSEGGGGGSTTEVVIPEQTISASSSYVRIPNVVEALIEGEEYIYTVNGVSGTGTAVNQYGSILLYTFNSSLIFDNSGGTMYFDVEDSSLYGSYTIKVEKITSSGGGGGSATLITKNITANGTYSASDDSADGYSSVTVNVPSSAASSWTKVAETSYQVSTTSTTTTTVATWATGHSELWTSSKWIYVRIRDTAGKRAGYFYGSDQFFMVYSTTEESTTVSGRFYIRCDSNGSYGVGSSSATSGYGVFASALYNDGSILIRSRYGSNISRTINGTYKVEVYLLDPAGGVPIFT